MHDHAKIMQLWRAGKSRSQIATLLDMPKSSVTYAVNSHASVIERSARRRRDEQVPRAKRVKAKTRVVFVPAWGCLAVSKTFDGGSI